MQTAPSSAHSAKTYLLRTALVLLGLCGWWGTQALLGARKPMANEQEMSVSGAVLTRGDGLLELVAPINAYLQAHRQVAHGLLIVSSAMIDVLGLFLLGWSIFGASLRPFLGLLVLFALRQITQTLSALPQPEGLIWEQPWLCIGGQWYAVPSLLVTYNVANDFFFSGHTAIAVYGTIEVARFGGRRTWLPASLAALFLIAVVIVLRAHYTMDVFAAVIAAILAAAVSRPLAECCDKAFCRQRS